MENPITFRSKVSLRIVVKTYQLKAMKRMFEINDLEFLQYCDQQLEVCVITILEVPVLKIALIKKLMKDEKIEDLT